MTAVRPPKITSEMLRGGRRDIFPELTRFRERKRSAAKTAAARQVSRAVRPFLERLYPIPVPTYAAYRKFVGTGDRKTYETQYFARRANLTAAVAGHLLSPSPKLLDAAHDYLWATCEETTWILPAHERTGLDLFATETALALVEAVQALGDELAAEVRERIEYEVQRRIVDPYLSVVGRKGTPNLPPGCENLVRYYSQPRSQPVTIKYRNNNWCGVCNGSIGAVLLYLVDEPVRLARALNDVLKSLYYFVDVAFTADGASVEGAGYWHYGLINFVAFSELLRNRTGGRVDLLSHPKMRLIAQYPLKVMLSPGHTYNHSDCTPVPSFHPGIIARLAQRTGVGKLRGIVRGAGGGLHRLPMVLRDILWWDGRLRAAPLVTNALLPEGGIFRLKSGKVVLAGKAGHNAESHNHNDVGSFVVHADGEDLLSELGAPTYCRDFFSSRRYKLFVHTQSLGHSVPVVGRRQQEAGKEYRGEIVRFGSKSVEIEFAGAYPVRRLTKLHRTLWLLKGGRFVLEDSFAFKGKGLPVQEAFVTQLPVTVRGGTARIRGRKNTLLLNIKEPRGVGFRVEKRDLQEVNPGKAQVLWRISADIPAAKEIAFHIEGTVRRRRGG